MKFDSLNLYVADMAKTIQFYTQLGFKFDKNAKYKDYVKLNFESTSVAFYSWKSINQFFNSPILEASNGNQFNISFRVESPEQIDDIYETMKNIEFFPFRGPENVDWGQRVLFYKDPDGNLIEINAYLSQK